MRYDKVKRAEMKKQFFNMLGNKCFHCGFDDTRALQIDHKYGGGKKEYKRLGSFGVLRRALLNPELYQLLCANCNWIKAAESKNLHIGFQLKAGESLWEFSE